MMRSRAAVLAVSVALTATGTWLGGWWMVPVAAAAVSIWRRDDRLVAELCSLGALLAWAALLGYTAAGGRLGVLGQSVGGVVGVPGFAFVILTLAFPALLAWSAATVMQVVLQRGAR